MSLESFARSPGRALRVVALTVVAVVGCGGAPPAVAPPPAPAPQVAAHVLDQVPSDTPYAMSVDQVMIGATSIEITTLRAIVQTGLQAALLTPAAAAAATAEARLASEIARELLPFDDAALRRVGWLPGESEFVMYGHGLLPVMRIRADGRAAHAAWRRVTARAAVQLPEASWHGAPYVTIPASDDLVRPLVVMFLPHQVAIAMTTRPDAILAYLADEAPAPEPLLPHWLRSHLDPQRPDAVMPVMWLNPRAAVPRLRGSDDLAQLGVSRGPACLTAAAEALEVVPSLSSMFWRHGDELVSSYTAPMPPALQPLFVDGRAVAHWLGDARPGMQLAWRLPADELTSGLATLAAPILAAARACGDPADDPLAGLAALPLRQLRGGTVAMEVTDGEAAVVAVIEALDVGVLWGWLQGVLPLGRFPRPGEVQAVSLMPGQQLFAIATTREVAFSLGWPDAARLQALLASGGRAEPLVLDYDATAMAGARFLGRTMADDGKPGRRTEVIVDAHGVIARSRSPLPIGMR